METLGWILFWIFWTACGIFGYGLVKNNTRLFLLGVGSNYPGYNDKGETLCLMYGLGGPIGLLASLSIARSNNLKLGFCYYMPEELCSPEYLERMKK